MPGTQAADVLVITASICLVILTVAAVVVAAFAVSAILRVNAFLRLMHYEASRAIRFRDRLWRRVRFAGIWAKNFGWHVINPND